MTIIARRLLARFAARLATLAAFGSAALLCACASGPDTGIVPGPLSAPPMARPVNLERVNSGSIYQPGMGGTALFLGERRPQRVGDTLKVDISESLSASSSVATDVSRESKLAQKGPGAQAGMGLLSGIMNLDASASGSHNYKGDGKTENTSKFNGQLGVTVINVLPNGNLVVAGDREIALNGGVNLLRFSGIVNPQDIRAGNIVASADTVNARLEVVGRGEVSQAASRSWIQRVLAESLSFW